MKKILILFLVLFVNTLFASSVKDQIHDQLKETHTSPLYSYKKSRKYLFGYLHYDNGKIIDVYCNQVFDSSDGVGRNRIPNHRKINTEHTHPRSKFNSNFSYSKQLSDLHNLYPTNSRANGARSNYPFMEVNGNKLSYCPASKTNNGTFEPPDIHKGNVARAKFYMSIRYKISIPPKEENTLRDWHYIDPVDQDEIIRNDRIKGIQGNSNIFIQDPELVKSIFNF